LRANSVDDSSGIAVIELRLRLRLRQRAQQDEGAAQQHMFWKKLGHAMILQSDKRKPRLDSNLTTVAGDKRLKNRCKF
jgi:hypothetical protein